MDALPADLNARLMAMLEESERLEAAQREGEPVAADCSSSPRPSPAGRTRRRSAASTPGPAGPRASAPTCGNRVMAERGLRAEKQAQRAGPGIGPT